MVVSGLVCWLVKLEGLIVLITLGLLLNLCVLNCLVFCVI